MRRLQRIGEAVIAEAPPKSIDLLAFAPVRRFVLWAGFPYLFQLFTLAALLALAILGWGQMTPHRVTGMALVVAALWFSLRELRLVNGDVRRVWRFPAIAVTLIFGFVILGWGFFWQ